MPQPFILSAELKLTPPSSSNLAAIKTALKKELGGINAKINVQTGSTKNLDDLSKKITGVASSIEKLNSQSQITTANILSLGKSFGGVRTDVANLAPSITKLNSSINNVGKVAHASSVQLVSFGEQAGLAARRFLAFSIPTSIMFGLVNAIKTGVVEIFNFQREVIKIAQATDRPISSIKALGDEVSRLSVGFGVSSKELINSAKILVQAGFSADEATTALAAIAKSDLAPSFENMEQTTEGVISLFQQFGKDASKLEGQLGAINAVSAKYAVESKDLIAAIQKSGGAFKVAGGNLEELIGLFTSVRQTTRESADTIAVAFRTIFTRLQRPETIKFLREFNVELVEAGKFVGPVEAIQRLNRVIGALPKGDLRITAIAEEVGGLRQISKTIPLIQQAALGQEAINVALRGTDSLSQDAQQGMEGFLRQLAKVKEDFLAIFREMSETKSFQIITSTFITLLTTANHFLRTLKDIVPLLVLAGGFFAARGAARGAGGFLSKLTHRDLPITTGLPFASGGLVPGPNSNKDIIPAMLMPGEFVLNKDAVARAGLARLTALNNSNINVPRQKNGITFFGPQEDLKPLVDAIAAQLGKLANKATISSTQTGVSSSALLGNLIVGSSLTKGVELSKLAGQVGSKQINVGTGKLPPGLGGDALKLINVLTATIKTFKDSTDEVVESIKKNVVVQKQAVVAQKEAVIVQKAGIPLLEATDVPLHREGVISAIGVGRRSSAKFAGIKRIFPQGQITIPEIETFSVLPQEAPRIKPLDIPSGVDASLALAPLGPDLGPALPLSPSSLVVPRTPFQRSANKEAQRQQRKLRFQLTDPVLADKIVANAINRANKVPFPEGAKSTSRLPIPLEEIPFISRGISKTIDLTRGGVAGQASFIDEVEASKFRDRSSSFLNKQRKLPFGIQGISKSGVGAGLAFGGLLVGGQIQSIGQTTKSAEFSAIGGGITGGATAKLLGLGTRGTIAGVVLGIGNALVNFNEQLKKTKIEQSLAIITRAFNDLQQSISGGDIKSAERASKQIRLSSGETARELQDELNITTSHGSFGNAIGQFLGVLPDPKEIRESLQQAREQNISGAQTFIQGRLSSVKTGDLRTRLGEEGILSLRGALGQKVNIAQAEIARINKKAIETDVLGNFTPLTQAERKLREQSGLDINKIQRALKTGDLEGMLAALGNISPEALRAKQAIEDLNNQFKDQSILVTLVADRLGGIANRQNRIGAQNDFITGLGGGIGGFKQPNRQLRFGDPAFIQNLLEFSTSRPDIQGTANTLAGFAKARNIIAENFAGGGFDRAVQTGDADQDLINFIGNIDLDTRTRSLLAKTVEGAAGTFLSSAGSADVALKNLFSGEGSGALLDSFNDAIQEQTRALDAHADVIKSVVEFTQRIIDQGQQVNRTQENAIISAAQLRANRTGESVSSLVGNVGLGTFGANQALLGGGFDPVALGGNIRGRIQGLQQFVAGGGGGNQSGITSIIQEQAAITNLVQSLRNLADPANLAADAVRELSEVENERAARLGLLTNFLGQDRGGQRQFIRTAQNAQQFAAGGAGFFDTLSNKRQQELISFIGANAGISIGGRKLGAIANQQLPFTRGGRQLQALGFGVDEVNARGNQLEGQIGFANEVAVEAQKQLLEVLRTQGALLQTGSDLFNSATDKFSVAVGAFDVAVGKIPAAIDLRGINEIQINIAGANGLNQLASSIQKAVLTSVGEKLKQVIPDVAGKVDKAFG